MPHLVVDITGHGFGHAGQTAPVVEELRRRRPALRLTIRTAVPPAQLTQLFAPGFATAPPPPDIGLAMHSPIRVDRARSRETGGTGLGLAIVRHVANNHGGEVAVRSREGEGSTFTLRIPVQEIA